MTSNLEAHLTVTHYINCQSVASATNNNICVTVLLAVVKKEDDSERGRATFFNVFEFNVMNQVIPFHIQLELR